MSTLEDTLKIIRATSITPKRVCYYVAASWKWKAYQKALEKVVSAKLTQGELIKALIKESELKILAKTLVAFIGQIIMEINKMSDIQKKRRINVGIINEKRVLKEAEVFFKKELNTKISIYIEEESKRYDPKK